MPTDVVFDAEPLIAYLYDEPGAERVETLLTEIYDGERGGVLSEVTATEIVYKVARLQGGPSPGSIHLDAGREHLQNFVDDGVEVRPPTDSWETAARVKAAGGVSLGDAFAVALAARREDLLVVGADDDFADLPVDVACERVRSEPA